MSVRKTGSFPGPIDTQINEIIRSIRELEERVMDIKKSLEPQTEETTYDLERHVFNRDNPHLVTAAQLKALPLEFVLDASSVYIPFHNTLKSTKGLKPSGLYGATRTDYGLIYNDDGSLCATLLPEGGVAVEEETTNLESITNGRLTTLTPNGTTPPQINLITTKTPFGTEAWEVTFPTTLDTGYAGSRAQGGTIAFQRSLPYTFAVWIKGDITGMLIYYTGAHGIGRLDATGREWDGWKEYSLVYTFPDGSDTVADYLAIVATSSPAAGKKIYVSMAQVEQKPYRTSPCEGTRPPGALSYPITLGRAGTIAIKWIKHKRLESGYEMPFRVANNVFEANIRDNLVGINSFVVTDFTWNPFEEHSFVYTWDMDSDDIKQWLYLDGDLKATRTWAPPDPTAYSVLWVGCGGVGYSPFNGIIKNFLLRPHAVSPETVAAWHSLDAPFIDSCVALSQDIPYSNTVDEFKNSTANFAMVNVEGIVKLYARTPEGIIIIETLGNTEVI